MSTESIYQFFIQNKFCLALAIVLFSFGIYSMVCMSTQANQIIHLTSLVVDLQTEQREIKQQFLQRARYVQQQSYKCPPHPVPPSRQPPPPPPPPSHQPPPPPKIAAATTVVFAVPHPPKLTKLTELTEPKIQEITEEEEAEQAGAGEEEEEEEEIALVEGENLEQILDEEIKSNSQIL